MTVEQQILQAVLYADMFDYPMTKHELWRWLPTTKRIPMTQFVHAITSLRTASSVQSITPFIIFPNRGKLLGVHARRLMISRKKWKIATKTAKLLRWIPTIQFIGVTGSLAMNNAEDQDDIDFCIVTTKGTVWITRLLTTILVEIFAHRRHPSDIHVKDKICLNMFLGEDALAMDPSLQDVYIAHELLQMVPLWERKGIERQLLTKNRWVRAWYRHAYDERMKLKIWRIVRNKRVERLLAVFERPVRWFQLRYMAGRRTIEIIRENSIRFHPTDIRGHTITTYLSRLKSYKIPLDNRYKHI